LQFEPAIKHYIFNLDMLGGYDIFLHVFNINRFKLFQFGENNYYARIGMEGLLRYTDQGFYVTLGLAPEVYYFLS